MFTKFIFCKIFSRCYTQIVILMYTLSAQFRYSGAEVSINWVDHKIRQTGNYNGWNQSAFEFKHMDNPRDLYQAIMDKASEGYKARLLA